ncbi:MAG: hypothetical protein J6M53_05405 [Bacteroidaceae bacterium]|nr:hypothetical protein [Bacteroidaceae bacterium]
MNPKTLFDFHSYLYALTEKNKLARQHGFLPCSCSGIGYLEDLLTNNRSHSAFVCLSDTTEDSTTRKGGGWFKRRVFTVFILCRYNTRSQQDYRDKLGVCRELFRQLHSRFLIDEHDLQSDLAFLNVQDIRSRELGGQFLNGCTGLYFMLAIDEPIDLQFNKEEWLIT